MIHEVVSEIWVFRMGSTILEHPVFQDKMVNRKESGKDLKNGTFLRKWDK